MRDEPPTLRRQERVLIALGIGLGLLGTLAWLCILAMPLSWYGTWRPLFLLAFPGAYLSNVAAILMGFGSPHGGIPFMPLWLLMATPINIGLYCAALLAAGALWRLLRRRKASR